MKCSAVTVICNFISCTEARVHSEFFTSGQEMENLYSCLDYDELCSHPSCSSKGFKTNILIQPNHSWLSVSQFIAISNMWADKALENLGGGFLLAYTVRFRTFLSPQVNRLSFSQEQYLESENKCIFRLHRKINIISDKLQAVLTNISIHHCLYIFCIMCSM